jgi:putative membrane protein
MRHDPSDLSILGLWTFDPTVLATFAASSTLYARGVVALHRAAGRERGVQRWQIASFALGQLVTLVALVSPIDALSDALFSAHMTQHELLMIVAAPLVVVGRPLVAMAWGLPRRLRAPILRLVRKPAFASSWRALTHPVVVLLGHGAIVWAWHLPPWFEGAMRSEPLHAVQHLTFFVSAALFWWAIFHGRFGRSGHGVAVLFVFATAMHTSLLGALITVAQALWYPIYDGRTRIWGLDALEDQQLAGLVMWVPAGVLLALVALALFAVWMRGIEARSARREGRGARVSPARAPAPDEAPPAAPAPRI